MEYWLREMSDVGKNRRFMSWTFETGNLEDIEDNESIQIFAFIVKKVSCKMWGMGRIIHYNIITTLAQGRRGSRAILHF